MKKTTFILMMVLLAISGFAQTIIIKDKMSFAPIQGVIIRVNSTDVLSTDVKGSATINTKNYTSLQFSMVGYTTLVKTKEELAKANHVVYLTERAYNTNEVVISANRFEESSEKLSQQIAVIKAKQIAQSNLQTTADLLQNTGLVNVQKSQAGGGSPVIRGFEANKVLMVIDGVRLNNAIYRGGHLQNVITMDQSVLERMEILFGSGSLMYGSDALGGVMHFYTKEPKLASNKDLNFSGSAFSRYGSMNNERTAHVDLSIANNKIGSLTSFTVSDFDDLRQGKNRSKEMGSLGIRNFYQARINGVDTMLRNSDSLVQKSSGYTQYDFMQKFLFKQNERLTHVLNIQYSTSTDIPRYDRLTDVNNAGVFRTAQWYYGPQERLLASYQLRLNGNTIYDKAQVTFAYQAIEESRHNRNWNSSKLNHRTENVSVYSVNADFDKMLGRADIRYGIEFIYNDVQSTAYAENINTGLRSNLDTRYPVDGSSTQSVSAYLTSSHRITDKLTLNEGLRYSYFNLYANFSDKTFFAFPYNEINQTNNMLTTQVGMVYKPDQSWKIAFNIATGFRSPNVDDLAKVFDSQKGDTLGSSSTVGTVILPNPDLKAEHTYNAELSISKSIADNFQITGIGFFTRINDAIVTQNSTFNGVEYIVFGDTLSRVQKNVNAGQAYIAGFSALLNYEINDKFSTQVSYNYTYGRVTSVSPTTPLDHIAPAFGKFSFVWKAKKMRTEVFALFNAAKKLEDYNLAGEDNLNYATVNGMPAWYTLNLRYSYQLNQYFMAQLNVDNITDRAYRVFASGINSGGRNIGLTLRANF
jgi:hemoglobin/transferrin/lactoferrin receptor protein